MFATLDRVVREYVCYIQSKRNVPINYWRDMECLTKPASSPNELSLHQNMNANDIARAKFLMVISEAEHLLGTKPRGNLNLPCGLKASVM